MKMLKICRQRSPFSYPDAYIEVCRAPACLGVLELARLDMGMPLYGGSRACGVHVHAVAAVHIAARYLLHQQVSLC
jgi:hypothetical protein